MDKSGQNLRPEKSATGNTGGTGKPITNPQTHAKPQQGQGGSAPGAK